MSRREIRVDRGEYPLPPPSKCAKVLYYTWKLCAVVFSHFVMISLVVAYCILGAVTFEKLEAQHEREVKQNISQIRNNTTQSILTMSHTALLYNQSNWTSEVVDMLKDFENAILLEMKVRGWDGNESTDHIQWTFTGALFYSIIVITTIGECVVPECEAANSTLYSTPWLEGALPSGSIESRCSRRAPLDPQLPCQDGTTFGEELMPCDHWLYQSNNTIVTEFNLACQEWKRTLVGTVHNIGMLVSLPILGYISDRWGRKRALVLSCTLVGAIGSLKAFSISYEMYITVEFLETIAGASAFPAAYILTIELLGQDKRVLTTAFLGIMLVLGGLSFALLAKAFQYWRTFILVVYPPSLLFILYIYLLPESIRWLLSKGRKEEAVEIIMSAAKMNKVTLSDETMKQLTEEKAKPLDEKKDEKPEEGLWMQVFHSPIIMTRLAICSWWWITCTFVFYGLAINSVSLAGDKYTNYMLVVSVEVIAVVTNALVLDRIGRKKTLLCAYTVCGIACVVIPFVPKSLPWLATLLYLVGKVAITQAFSGIYMYTSELFPTHARHSLLGFCSMVGRIGSIVAPQMPLLAIYVDWLPSVLFGSTALIAGGLMLTTPETLNTRLPDTIREAEQIAQRMIPAAPKEDVQMTTRA